MRTILKGKLHTRPQPPPLFMQKHQMLVQSHIELDRSYYS